MLATPYMGQSIRLLAYAGLLGTVLGIVVWCSGRFLWKAGLRAKDTDGTPQVEAARIGWGAVATGIGITLTAVGLVLLVLLALVLTQ